MTAVGTHAFKNLSRTGLGWRGEASPQARDGEFEGEPSKTERFLETWDCLKIFLLGYRSDRELYVSVCI